MKKLASFLFRGIEYLIDFQETQIVKDGVSADIYKFVGDETRDLAIVTVSKGFKTPLQKILVGSETIEGLVSGNGKLSIGLESGKVISYLFPSNDSKTEVSVEVGQTMQWEAIEDLIFYEVCYPPYQDGRFKNLSE